MTKTLGGVTDTYTYDHGDKLTEITRGGSTIRSFTYEKFGRMLTSVENSVTTTFAYDFESRLTSVTKSGMTTNSFLYNGFDTRYSKTDAGGTTTYKRNGSGVTSPVLKSSISGGATTTHTPGISERTSGTTTFNYSGLKNNELQTVGTNQTVNASKDYDAFGNQTASSGTWSGHNQYGGPYGYQTEPDTGLKLLGHRYYDPTIGRFLTRDPAKDGRNWFPYCSNNPIAKADPLGLLVLTTGLSIQGIGGFISGSGGLSVSIDHNFHIGLTLTKGSGQALGLYGGGSQFGGIEPEGTVSSGTSFQTIKGIATPSIFGEYTDTGISGGGGPGGGIGIYNEERESITIDLTQEVLDRVGSIRDDNGETLDEALRRYLFSPR